jgi:hypothetical protein
MKRALADGGGAIREGDAGQLAVGTERVLADADHRMPLQLIGNDQRFAVAAIKS